MRAAKECIRANMYHIARQINGVLEKRFPPLMTNNRIKKCARLVDTFLTKVF